MGIQSAGLENHIQYIRSQESVQTTAKKEQSTIGETIQPVNQQMKNNSSDQSSFEEKTILNVIDVINKKLANKETQVEVDFHEKTKEMIIRLVNKQSKEIIREIPSEKMIDMIDCFCEIAGLYVDEKR